MPPKRNLLLTLDAFDTLFRPRIPIAEQYIDEARKHGMDLQALGVTPGMITGSFARAFQLMNQEHPFYGKKTGMTNDEWWEETIHHTFIPLLTATSSSRSSSSTPILPKITSRHRLLLPTTLPRSLIDRFSGPAAYELYPDVLPFLDTLTHPSARWPYAPLSIPNSTADSFSGASSTMKTTSDDNAPTTILGILSNTDPRVKVIMNNLGIGSYFSQFTLSYDHEVCKPDVEIFRRARREALGKVYGDEVFRALREGEEENPNVWRNPSGKGGLGKVGEKNPYPWDFIHVGNDLVMDYVPTCKIEDYIGVWIDRRVAEPETETSSPTPPPPPPIKTAKSKKRTKNIPIATSRPTGIPIGPTREAFIEALSGHAIPTGKGTLYQKVSQKLFLHRPRNGWIPGIGGAGKMKGKSRGKTDDPVRDVNSVVDLEQLMGLCAIEEKTGAGKQVGGWETYVPKKVGRRPVDTGVGKGKQKLVVPESNPETIDTDNLDPPDPLLKGRKPHEFVAPGILKGSRAAALLRMSQARPRQLELAAERERVRKLRKELNAAATAAVESGDAEEVKLMRGLRLKKGGDKDDERSYKVARERINRKYKFGAGAGAGERGRKPGRNKYGRIVAGEEGYEEGDEGYEEGDDEEYDEGGEEEQRDREGKREGEGRRDGRDRVD